MVNNLSEYLYNLFLHFWHVLSIPGRSPVYDYCLISKLAVHHRVENTEARHVGGIRERYVRRFLGIALTRNHIDYKGGIADLGPVWLLQRSIR